jgi:hypothetical protein
MALRGLSCHAPIGQKNATPHPAGYQLFCSLVRRSLYITEWLDDSEQRFAKDVE